MTPRITAEFAADLEVRPDGRTVTGLAVPFDVPTTRDDGVHVFRRGAFARTIAERGHRVRFMVNHEHDKLPIGRATVLREDPAGLYGEFRVSQTRQGDEVLELIRDGALDSLSVGIAPVNVRRTDDVDHEFLEVKLYEVSAVSFAQFDDGARITGVQNTDPELVLLSARLDALRPPPGLSVFEARLRFWKFGG
jgi:HK97 family phage prohead protease